MTRPLWEEDECLRHDPDAERIGSAFRRITGEDYDGKAVVETYDGGDHEMRLMPNGYVVYCGYDGYAIYPPGTPLRPKAPTP